jgi:hypothetical protein
MLLSALVPVYVALVAVLLVDTSTSIFIAVAVTFTVVQIARIVWRRRSRQKEAESDRIVNELLTQNCPECQRPFGQNAFRVLYGQSPVQEPTTFVRFMIAGCHRCLRLFVFNKHGQCEHADGIPVDDASDELKQSLLATAERD